MAVPDKYEQELEGIWFTIAIGQEEHIAFISDKALDEHFDARQGVEDRVTAYRRHRRRIHAAARHKSSRLHGLPKQVLLRARDF